MFNVKKTTKHLFELCKDDKEIDEEFLEKPHKWWDRHGVSVYLDYDDILLFKEALKEVRKENKVKYNFLEEYIEEKLKDIVSKAFKLPLEKRFEFIEIELNLLKLEFKEDIKEWIFWIPIVNLVLVNKEPLNVGNVIFFVLDETKGSELTEKICIVKANDIKFKKDIKKNYIDNNVGKVFAEVKATGVKKFAQGDAMNQIRMAINALRLYIPSDDINFGINGEITPKFYRQSFEFTADFEYKSFPIKLMGSMREYVLDNGIKKFMEYNNFEKLNQILKNKKPNFFEKKILTAVYWFGEAMGTEIFVEKEIHEEKSRNYENFEYFKFGEKYIKLFTALESILIFEKNEPITLNLSERSAFLLAENYEERKEIKKMIKDLYEVRSKIMHQGLTFVSKYDIKNLTEITRIIIFTLLELKVKYKFKTKEDLPEYFEKLKLS